MRRVAFVVQRAGVEIAGGAEALCLAIAEELDRDDDLEVTVLTTCARDYMTWANAYPPGHARARSVHVIRFPVDRPRNRVKFDRLSRAIRYGGDPASEELWMQEQGPVSTALQDHVKRFRTHYDAFVFFGYLYATTYHLLPIVEERAILVPLAHDEWTIHLRMWDAFFELPAAYIFNTSEERDFVRGRFPHVRIDGPIAGIGIAPPAGVSAARFRAEFGITKPFVLYLGRIDESKGCAELVRSFTLARASLESDLQLVLVGDVQMAIESNEHVRVIGQVDDRTKWDALAACDLTASLSPYESLSMSLLEGWAMSKPAIVSSRAAVLVGQCKRAQGGVWVTNDVEFGSALALLDGRTRSLLGEQGRSFVERNYTWPRVVHTYRVALGSIFNRALARSAGTDVFV